MMRHSDRRILLIAIVTGMVAVGGLLFVGRKSDGVSATATDSDSVSLALRSRYLTGGNRYGTGGNRYATGGSQYYAQPTTHSELFCFDPNTADSLMLLRLGLQPSLVRNIYKYRAHGGVFRTKEDFAKLYNLTLKDYRRLAPYITIGADYAPAALSIRHSSAQGDTTRMNRRKIAAGSHIILNTADTTELQRVPGIGSYWASQIARYGRQLGGYVSIDQLDEIDGFPQEAKAYFAVSNASTQKLAVNRLTLQQLRRHPYLNFYQARAICDFRRLRGRIDSLQQLRFDDNFTAADLKRLAPYVSFE